MFYGCYMFIWQVYVMNVLVDVTVYVSLKSVICGVRCSLHFRVFVWEFFRVCVAFPCNF